MPYDILKKLNLVLLAARLNMSPAQQSAYTKTLITELKEETSIITASFTPAYRSRAQVATKVSSSCNEQWFFPKYTTLYWDTKFSVTLSNKYKTEERLNVGNIHQQKILAVSAYLQGTDRKYSSIIADLIYEQLVSWKCA